MNYPHSDYELFLRWLILAGVLLFAGWMLSDLGLLQSILTSDPTRITLVILLLFIIGCGHCATRSLYLSAQQGALDHILTAANQVPDTSSGNDLTARWNRHCAGSLPGQLITGAIYKQRNSPGEPTSTHQGNQLLAQVMAEQARGQHEVGWFVCSLLIKLGLLGTVVGFVLMLAPMAQLESFDLSDIQGLLQRMTTGMGVALNTTLVGLSCSMLLSLQYLMLDRAADRLVAQTIAFVENRLPQLAGEG